METSAKSEANEGGISAVQANACPHNNVPQEIISFCCHRGHGCTSQSGYRCLKGKACEPADSNGRRFVVYEWLQDGQRLATRQYLDDVNGITIPAQKKIAPILVAS